MTKQEALQQAANALKTDVLSVFELAYANNPVSMVAALRTNGRTTSIAPDNNEVGQIIKRAIFKKDVSELRDIMERVQYNGAANNWTTNPELWQLTGVNPGDFNTLLLNAINYAINPNSMGGLNTQQQQPRPYVGNIKPGAN